MAFIIRRKMKAIENIFISSEITYLILIPFLRELAAILLAIAISKDNSARHNRNNTLWGVLTLFFPALTGIAYFIYSRMLNKKDIARLDKKKAKKSKRLTKWAIFLFIITLILTIICTVTGAISGIATVLSNDEARLNSLKYDEYYDMNKNKYDNPRDVILYDKNGNAYHTEEDPDGWNYYPYYDENGNKYDLDKCYISRDGYLYYDEDDSLIAEKHSILIRQYDITFHDSSNEEYKLVGNYAFFDENGKIVINHMGRRGPLNIYAFE